MTDPSYWDTPSGRLRIALGAQPVPDSEQRFHEEISERLTAHRRFREAWGDSRYVPLSEAEERQARQRADDELRMATARGLAGAETLPEGQGAVIARRLELIAMTNEANRNVLVTRGPQPPEVIDAWRTRVTGPARGVAGPS